MGYSESTIDSFYKERYQIIRQWDHVMKAAETYDTTKKIYEGNWIEFDENRKAVPLTADPTHVSIYPVKRGPNFYVPAQAKEYENPDMVEAAALVVIMGQHVVQTDLFKGVIGDWTGIDIGMALVLEYVEAATDGHKKMVLKPIPDDKGTYIVVGYLEKSVVSTDTTIQVRILGTPISVAVAGT